MSGSEGGTVTCPSCGKEARGNFCHHCGASLGGRFCNQCGNELAAGVKFCNQCGAPAGTAKAERPAAPARSAGSGKGRARSGAGAADRTPAPSHRQAAVEVVGGSNLPWWIAGAALFGLILVVGWSMVRPAGPVAPAGGAAAGGVSPNATGVTDITQMTPREAADRLFNRVMTTISQGDTAGAMGFQPMAVQAYVRAEPLDLDGLYHQALLELLADPSAALATAQRMLEVEPNHLLALGVAARASLSLDDEEAAADYYERLLASYDEEAPRTLPEYEGHRNLVADYRTEAQSFLDARS